MILRLIQTTFDDIVIAHYYQYCLIVYSPCAFNRLLSFSFRRLHRKPQLVSEIDVLVRRYINKNCKICSINQHT